MGYEAVALVKTVAAAVTVTPADQTTTASYADVTGSTLDTLNLRSVSYTCVNSHGTLTIKWKVLGANQSTFADAVEVQAEASIAAAGGVGSYSTAQAVWRYYKVQVIDDSGHGTAQVRGVAKG